jgi:hypothetical protein
MLLPLLLLLPSSYHLQDILFVSCHCSLHSFPFPSSSSMIIAVPSLASRSAYKVVSDVHFLFFLYPCFPTFHSLGPNFLNIRYLLFLIIYVVSLFLIKFFPCSRFDLLSSSPQYHLPLFSFSLFVLPRLVGHHHSIPLFHSVS